MSQPILSILIPTVKGREQWYSALVKLIVDQCGAKINKEVEIVSYPDNKEITIGEKREMLYKEAHGVYSWQVDDDDRIAANAIELILEATKDNTDCITFEESCLINGASFKSNHSLYYEDWEGDGNSLFPDGYHYHRTPFYKSVIKTEIARKVAFEHIRYGEDHAWARALKPHLKSEAHIGQELYLYIHNSKPEEHNERYGINRG